MFHEYSCLSIEDIIKQQTKQSHLSYNPKASICTMQNKQEKITFENDPHVVANCIKKWFREMEEPLCQYDLVKEFLKIGSSKKQD